MKSIYKKSSDEDDNAIFVDVRVHIHILSGETTDHHGMMAIQIAPIFFSDLAMSLSMLIGMAATGTVSKVVDRRSQEVVIERPVITPEQANAMKEVLPHLDLASVVVGAKNAPKTLRETPICIGLPKPIMRRIVKGLVNQFDVKAQGLPNQGDAYKVDNPLAIIDTTNDDLCLQWEYDVILAVPDTSDTNEDGYSSELGFGIKGGIH